MSKIFISDFDYTFLNLDYLHNIEVMQKFVHQGNMFLIATARNLSQFLEEASDFYVPYFFLICDDGAAIYDRKNLLLSKKTIDSVVAKEIYQKIKSQKFIAGTYLSNGNEFIDNDFENVTKIVAKPKNGEKAEKLLKQILMEYKSVTGYISEYWLHIIPKDASKGNAIEELIDRFHFEKENIYVLGDNVNDISMLQKYKGYVMDTAEEEIKKYGIETVHSINECLLKIENNSSKENKNT